MFIVKPENMGDMQEAILLLKNYAVEYTTEMYNNKIFMVVRECCTFDATRGVKAKLEDDMILCELAFQMNYHQDGRAKLCDVCKMEIERTGEGKDTCGHLTFTHPIEGI